MRILLINQFPLKGSGSGIYVTDIAKGLVKRGHEVCIIIPENTTKIKKINNVKIHPVFFKGNEEIEGCLGFNFPCMDLHPRSSFLFDDMTQKQIDQYEEVYRKAIEEEIIEFKPDVIHSQHIWINSGLLERYDVPYVITSHGAEFITYKKTDIFDDYGNKAIDGCENVIAISKDNMNEIIGKFPMAKHKLEFVKNGYNSNEFFIQSLDKKEILKKFSIEKEYEKIILYVGRISELKGLDTLLKAAKIYEKDNILTLIVGDGEFKKELCILKDELKLKNIVFLGSKEHEQLREIYNIADVFVLPSKKEALPLVALEAMACGTPAVVSNLPGIEEIITEEVGMIFEMDNAEMLAHKVNLILNKEIIFRKDIIADYAKKNYSEELLINKLLELYTKIKK